MSDLRYPSLYQVNTRVWLTELSRNLGRAATLDDVPDTNGTVDALVYPRRGLRRVPAGDVGGYFLVRAGEDRARQTVRA
jgi:hypothetical protein